LFLHGSHRNRLSVEFFQTKKTSVPQREHVVTKESSYHLETSFADNVVGCRLPQTFLMMLLVSIPRVVAFSIKKKKKNWDYYISRDFKINEYRPRNKFKK
jgi:hypothetical protein